MRVPILTKPVNAKYKIVQEFGFDNTSHSIRSNYYNHYGKKHPGVDFGMPVGQDVKASFSGIVIRKETHQGMGKVVGIRNGNIVALYAHLQDFRVDLGQYINSGHLIGISGETGMTGGNAHLHFELRDVSKRFLKDMVFKPNFGKPVSHWRPTSDCLTNPRFLVRLLKWQLKFWFSLLGLRGELEG